MREALPIAQYLHLDILNKIACRKGGTGTMNDSPLKAARRNGVAPVRGLLLLVCVLCLLGCAHDSYTVIPGGPGSQDRLASDLRACKHQATDRYFKTRSNTGAIIGGIFGGAIGGAIGGLADSSANGQNPDANLANIDPNVEACMKDRGYIGTSEN
jgi:hypothetical protein